MSSQDEKAAGLHYKFEVGGLGVAWVGEDAAVEGMSILRENSEGAGRVWYRS